MLYYLLFAFVYNPFSREPKVVYIVNSLCSHNKVRLGENNGPEVTLESLWLDWNLN